MQISSVQQLMRMELRAPSIGSLDRAWRWYLAGVRMLLPAPVKNLGWRAKNLLIEQSADGEPDLRRVVEHSWLGATRLVANDGVSDMPVSVALGGNKIYRTHLSLPSEASQTLENTIALRLDELSPIPTEDAGFAIGETTKSADGRINVEVAIAKKKTLANLQTQYRGAQITTIGAAPNQDGALRFIFRKERSTERANMGLLISATLLIAAALFLSVSIDVHLSRRLQGLEQHEASVLSALKDMRPALTLFDDADAATLAQTRGKPISNLVAAIQRTLAALPAESRVESINVSENGVQISGFVAINQSADASDPENLQRTASNRPGFDRFTHQTGAEALP